MILAGIIGVGVGIVVGALGAGGGILAVPILVYLLHQPAHTATAESLVIVGLTAAIAMVTRWRYVQFTAGITFGAVAIVGAILGSRLAPFVSDTVLIVMFALMLFVVGVVMLRNGIRALHREKKGVSHDDTVKRQPLWAVVISALGTGILTGFFGVGGGFVVVPVLILVLGIPIQYASSTSLLIMVMTSISGLVARIGTGIDIDWAITLIFGVSSMLGGMLGGPIAQRMRSQYLTIIFGCLLLGVAGFSLVMSL
ncbi:sulfite exporter TauE/SafE family protein [Arcanobacterium pinnipediorum]|uniref:Probable membrane transporter protein n=1 Tax=Arcanobacterium pinnipediorum TaxID=1503041 RepID=A0ABY5AI34_9ACTO|nr:sulfite exporter TauE/SafE family protein [Arcanobacterium pinnipediorum]USR78914.1 sulfite exporter TauE/SafE family protein [Arcanobacterium pinnipediorum]